MSKESELLELWLANVEEADLREELEGMRADEKAMIEAFHQDLQFGTAGLRGIIGAGTDRMNVHTVGRATQGFADYLNANFENPTVAIGRDSRNKGDEFVRLGVAGHRGVRHQGQDGIHVVLGVGCQPVELIVALRDEHAPVPVVVDIVGQRLPGRDDLVGASVHEEHPKVEVAECPAPIW